MILNGGIKMRKIVDNILGSPQTEQVASNLTKKIMAKFNVPQDVAGAMLEESANYNINNERDIMYVIKAEILKKYV
jgi:hypothetical protein